MLRAASNVIRRNSPGINRLGGGRAGGANNQHQKRFMGGGGKLMETSEMHRKGGEVFGFVMWMWIFHRFREDGDVLLGFRHPWEHKHDPWDISEEAHDDGQYKFEEMVHPGGDLQNTPLFPDMFDEDDFKEDDDEEEEEDEL